MDGSGQYFITIDTDKCVKCGDYPCVASCPAELFEIIIDDYDDQVAAIIGAKRKSIKYECAPCKPVSAHPMLPCISACTLEAIEHSW